MESTILGLLHRLRTGNSSAPRLTWYGPADERVELSGRVLDNWVAKTSNLLTEELDAERGTLVRLDLPPHWKSVVLALAAWQAGAVLSSGADDAGADLVFFGPPDAGSSSATAARTRVGVALGALEMSYPGQLPQGALDYAALVRQFADSYEPFDPPSPSDEALRTGAGSFGQAQLLDGFAARTEPRARVLVDGGQDLPSVLAQLLGAWSADGSAVLLHPGVEDTEHLRATENVTA